MTVSFSEWYRIGVSTGWITTSAAEYLVTTGTLYQRINALGHLFDDIADKAAAGNLQPKRLGRAIEETKKLLREIMEAAEASGDGMIQARVSRAWRWLNSSVSKKDVPPEEFQEWAREIGGTCIEIGKIVADLETGRKQI